MSVVVLISGRGSNLEALLREGIPVSAVISNVAGAGGLAIAAQRGVPTTVVRHGDFPSREAFEEALGRAIDAHAPRLIALAGFMRVLTASFVRRYAGRLLNIHPSLLPAFPGLHPHRQALAHGVRVSGATVHFVDEGVDTGPIVLQAAVPVRPDDTEETLAARVLIEEHRLYPEAVRLFAEGRLQIRGRRVEVRETS
jgi:phosphoribosylglycinamide formyltransferase 1